MILYHASKEIVEFPEVGKTKYTKDFSWGFYCTNSYEQAIRWANRGEGTSIINSYIYEPDNTLSVLKFVNLSDEWLDFSFHTLAAINCLTFEGSEIAYDSEGKR